MTFADGYLVGTLITTGILVIAYILDRGRGRDR